MSTIEQKLQQLRERWRKEPQNRWNIEQQVKVLKLGEKYPKYIPSEDETLVDDVKDALV